MAATAEGAIGPTQAAIGVDGGRNGAQGGATRGVPFLGAYSASKAAVRTFGEGLRGSLKKTGITVSVICPGYIKTPGDVRDSDHDFNTVSRRHARILAEHGRYFLVEEHGVTNGTYIKGDRLQPGDARELKAGDRVGFGMVVLFFEKPA